MHSQDLYYDYLFIKTTLDAGGYFDKCILVFGYYTPFSDVSLSSKVRQYMIGDIYYPIYGDSRNWAEPPIVDKWKRYNNITEDIKRCCENIAIQYLIEHGTYRSEFRKQKGLFDLGGRLWDELSDKERLEYAEKRTASHNKQYSHTSSYTENIQVFRNMMNLLCEHSIRPIVVIAPFACEYLAFTHDEMRNSVKSMLDVVAEGITSDIDFIDFNDENLFGAKDFMDTDHLNNEGMHKFSRYLVELFGR